MSSHIRHDENTQTIWYDGCPECDARAAGLPATLHELDDRNRIRAWHYMRAWSWTGGRWSAPRPSLNDQHLFATLYSIGVFLERGGIGPAEFERRLIETYDELVARLGSRLTSLKPITLALNGIDTTGIVVAEG